VDSLQHLRDQRAAMLWQARALRAAIPRQPASVAELMREEAERLEAVAEDCRRRVESVQAAL
jgi:hypothetical protein